MTKLLGKKLLRLTPITMVLLLMLGVRVIFLAWIYKELLVTDFDISAAGYTYTHSQFNLDNAEFLGMIEDDVLYSYAGAEYITGIDPSLINFETPFLGKYIYGLSIVLFGNPIVAQFTMGIGVLLVLMYAGKLTFGNWWVGTVSSLILSFDQIFIDQLFRAMLDLPQLLWLLLSIIFFGLFLKQTSSSRRRNTNVWLLLSGIFIGAMAATKFWVSAAFLYGVMVAVLVIYKDKLSTRKLLLSTIVLGLSSVFTFLVSYAVYFWYHPNPMDFVNLHIDTLRLYRSYVPEYPKGELLRIIFLGEWRSWWGDKGLITVDEWSIIWPISLIGFIFAYAKALLSKNTLVVMIGSFVSVYLFSNLLHLVFPRYLLLILPLMIFMSVGLVSRKNVGT